MEKVMSLKRALLTAGLLTATASAGASVIIFDNNNGGTAKTGTVETATAANTGNPDSWGPTLTFTDFTVTGGRSNGDNLNKGAFNINNIIASNVDQDLGPIHGGLGVCSENSSCSGSSDSFSSNVVNGSANTDEVLFFNFSQKVLLDTVWFNGDHNEKTDGNDTGSVNNSVNALFNIYYSVDGTNYSNLFSNQVRPTNREYLNTGLSDHYQYFAVTASGYGQHSSYVEAISYQAVSEPGTLALLGLGLAGLSFVRRKQIQA
tara:strand:+ start:696 stop:1478 length:783 start_codon:yes stop_codon:yes gene_type:complete